MDSLSDRQLVDMLLANDDDAVEYLFFHRCDGMFGHIIGSVLQSQDKKEDLITEFYLYLSADNWRRLRQFEFKSALNTWLTIVAVRFFKEKKEAEKTKFLATDPQYIEEAMDVADGYDLVHELSKVELYEAIGQLGNHRERLALFGMLTGKKAEQMSKELGCSVTAVYNLIRNAKGNLKKMMKGKGQ